MRGKTCGDDYREKCRNCRRERTAEIRTVSIRLSKQQTATERAVAVTRCTLKIRDAVIKEKKILQAAFDYVVAKNTIFSKVAAKHLKRIKN